MLLLSSGFSAHRAGATGVAIATAASRLIELAACVIVSFLSKDVKLNLTFMFIRSKVLFGDFVRLSLPALGNDVPGVLLLHVLCNPGTPRNRCRRSQLSGYGLSAISVLCSALQLPVRERFFLEMLWEKGIWRNRRCMPPEC